MSASPEVPSDDADDTSRGQTLLGLIVLVVIALAIYRLVQAVDPGTITSKRDPSFLDLVVGDRTVLTVVRLTVIFGAIYAAYSFEELMRLRRPISKFGPAQADAAAADIAQEAAAEGIETIDELFEEIDRLGQDNDSLVQEVQTLRATLQSREDAADHES